MDIYYRGRCRAVAVIDIIWSSIGLGSAVLTFFGLVLLSQGQAGENSLLRNSRLDLEEVDEPIQRLQSRSSGNDVHMFTHVMLGMVMLVIVINTVQLLAAIRLLKACDPETETQKALKCCRFWSGVTVFFVVFIGLNLFSTGRISFPGQIFSMAQIMFRALGLYYVSEFIKEVAHPVPILPVVGETFIPHTQPMRGYFPKPAPPPPYPQNEAPPPPYQEAPPPYTETTAGNDGATTGTAADAEAGSAVVGNPAAPAPPPPVEENAASIDSENKI